LLPRIALRPSSKTTILQLAHIRCDGEGDRVNATGLGRVFADSEVAALYRHRPAYPPSVFDILARLVVEPRRVLDAGAGTGALARGMLDFAIQIDAVDPSAAMISEGRRLLGGDDPRIRWL